jgi:hypothetical protein
MKLIRLMLLLTVATSLVAAQTTTRKPTQPAGSSGASKSAPAAGKEAEGPAPPRPGMAAGIEQQAAWQEVKYKNAVLEGDTDYLKKILALGYLSTSPDGIVTDRAQALDLLDAGEVKYESLALSDMKVRGYGPNLVVVNARADLKGRIQDRDISGAYRYTRVWVKQAGSWRMVAFQASRLAAPVTAPTASTSEQPK